MGKDLLIDDILKKKASSEVLCIPEDLNLKIKQTLTDLPVRKTRRSKFSKMAVATAIITLASSICFSVTFPAYARNFPVLGSVFQFLSEKNFIDRDYIEYRSDLNLSRNSGNVTVTINSIVYDEIDLSIAYTVESKEELKSEPHILDKEFKINGKITSFGSDGTGELINKNTYAGVDTFHISSDYLPNEITKSSLGGNVRIPDNFIMDLNIRQFSNGTKGSWNFKFKVSSDKIKGKVKQVKTSIDLSKLTPGLKVNEVIFTPINTVLRTVNANFNQKNMVKYYVFDDKGRHLLMKHQSDSGNENKMYSQYAFQNIYADTESVTFIPVVQKKNYSDNSKNTNGSYEFDRKDVTLNFSGTTVLSEGKFGEYTINKVESFDDKTLLYYECSNFLPSISPYGLMIKDEHDKLLNLGKDVVKELGDNKFVAQIEPLNKNKKYILTAVDLEKRYDMREDLKFSIPCN